MRWSLRFLDVARRQYFDLPHQVREQVNQKIIACWRKILSPQGPRSLSTATSCIVFESVNRVVYKTQRDEQIVTVVRIRHRRDAYRNL